MVNGLSHDTENDQRHLAIDLPRLEGRRIPPGSTGQPMAGLLTARVVRPIRTVAILFLFAVTAARGGRRLGPIAGRPSRVSFAMPMVGATPPQGMQQNGDGKQSTDVSNPKRRRSQCAAAQFPRLLMYPSRRTRAMRNRQSHGAGADRPSTTVSVVGWRQVRPFILPA